MHKTKIQKQPKKNHNHSQTNRTITTKPHKKNTKSRKITPTRHHTTITRPLHTTKHLVSTTNNNISSCSHFNTHLSTHYNKQSHINKTTLSSSSSPSFPFSPLQQRTMWYLPDDSLKSKIQRTLVSVFNLAPPPPSINVEEFALMSKMFQAIVDCRTEEQRMEGKIPKSVHVPMSSMTEDNRDNLSIQFSQLTLLIYDQDGTQVDAAAAYLRDCGAEVWALEGGANAFKSFVAQTRAGTYTRRVTLEEAQQHVHAQARAGARVPRKYDPNRVIEQFDPLLDQEETESDEKSESKHTISINPLQYDKEQRELKQKEQERVQALKQQVDV